jgi:hypothetical protein
MLLLRGSDTLSDRGKARLQAVFDLDDPTDELSAAWGVKEQVRRILNTSTVEAARHQKMILGGYVVAADMDETWRLWPRATPGGQQLRCSSPTGSPMPAQRPRTPASSRSNAPDGDTEIRPTTKPVSC